MREGPLRIIEPPFLAADRSAVVDPFATFDLPTIRHAIWARADIREELNQCGQWNGSFTLPGGSWIRLFLSRVS